MVTRSQSIQNFNSKMSDLVNSKFIVAEKKIAEVLISISDSVLLFELFKHATDGFDYAVAKSVCFAHDAQNNGYFKLPKNDGDVLAFGLSLLSEIDSGAVDIIALCEEFFPSPEGKQRSYSLFATQFLIPFQQTALKIANAMIESEDLGIIETVEEEKVEEKPEVEEEIKVKPIEKKKVDLGYVSELKKQALVIAESLKKGREPYDELYFALEELEGYLIESNLRGVTLAITAIKHINQSAKKLEVDLNKIAKTVSEIII